jgi:hypothetical protein
MTQLGSDPSKGLADAAGISSAAAVYMLKHRREGSTVGKAPGNI